MPRRLLEIEAHAAHLHAPSGRAETAGACGGQRLVGGRRGEADGGDALAAGVGDRDEVYPPVAELEVE